MSGVDLRPFRALRFNPAAAGFLPQDVLSPLHDVIDGDRAGQLLAANPTNPVRLILPRVAFPDSDDPDQMARSTYEQWIADGILVRDQRPALYVYRIDGPTGTQLGVLGALGLAQAADGGVVPHEDTVAKNRANRRDLLRALRANTEPIHLSHHAGPAFRALVDAASGAEPDLAVAFDGATHRVWAVTDEALVSAVEQELAQTSALIVDGHHRFGAAAEAWAALADTPGAERLLVYLVADDVATIRPIPRVIGHVDLAELAVAAKPFFDVEPISVRPTDADMLGALDGAMAIVSDGLGSTYRLRVRDHEAAAEAVADLAEPVRALDIAVAQRLLMLRCWGIVDETVPVVATVDAALREAASCDGVALVVAAPSMQDVRACADAGARMPRKSTLFVPKPIVGLVIRDWELS